MRKTLEL